jgi:branched-subunit amino acid ABC-type transport system permease component
MVPVLAEFIAIQTLNSLVYSMLLFLLALGLSLTFGLLRVVNLAHGGFYLLGAYVGLSVWTFSHSFLVAVVIAPLAAGLIGALLEKLWLRYFYARAELDQVILTFGFALVFADVMKMLWGKDIRGVPAPSTLAGAVQLGNFAFPSSRLLLIAVGIGLFVATWLAIERTRVGALIRASVADRVMVAGLGFNVRFLFTAIFAFGTGLAGLAGWLAAPITGVYPGLDFEVLITTLIVVVVGGLGNIAGAFWASLLIGGSETFGKAMLPEFASFIIFGVMAAVLLFRSWGRDEEEVE